MNIMYNTSRCEQRVTTDIIELLDALYAIEALADIRISNLSAVKKGAYLDFNMTVLNDGMLDADIVDLSIVVDGVVVEVLKLGGIAVGFGRTLYVENFKLPSRGFGVVDFHIDMEGVIRELDAENNVVRVTT